MGKKVAPKVNFSIQDLGEKTQISVKMKSNEFRFIPLLKVVIFIGSLFCLATGIGQSNVLMLISGICGFLLLTFISFKRFKPTTTFYVSNEGISLKKNLYAFNDIRTLGFKNPFDGQIYNTGTFTGNMSNPVGKNNYGIYIVYGTQELAIVPGGLNGSEVSVLYDKLVQICSQYGHKFS